ncbi:MFS transporter [Candidatus Peregrinibacteria bacterium]|nr:MFS transporter [Candidatus Peregrinibacteria bacterium]
MDANKAAFRANVWKIALSEFGSGAMLYIPVIVLFLQENGLSLTQVFYLQSIFAIFLMLGEIPTGYISDRWGRRNALALGSLLRFLGVLVYALSSSIPGFIAAEFLIAMGWSLRSGTVEAMLYDSLLETKDTVSFRKMIGQLRFYFFFAEAISALIAGLLAAWISLRAPFVASLIPFAISFILSLTLAEPSRHIPDETHHLKAMGRIAWRTLRKPAERTIILLYAIISTLGLSLFWFTQPYLQQIELPLEYYGLVHAVVVMAGAFTAKYTHTAEQYVDDRILLFCVSLLLTASIVTLGVVSSIYALALFVISRISWAVVTPLTSDMLNRMTSSDIRATVLSLKAFGQRVLFALVTPLFGLLVQAFTLNQALLVVGIVGGAMVAVVLLMMRPVWGKIPA